MQVQPSSSVDSSLLQPPSSKQGLALNLARFKPRVRKTLNMKVTDHWTFQPKIRSWLELAGQERNPFVKPHKSVQNDFSFPFGELQNSESKLGPSPLVPQHSGSWALPEEKQTSYLLLRILVPLFPP